MFRTTKSERRKLSSYVVWNNISAKTYKLSAYKPLWFANWLPSKTWLDSPLWKTKRYDEIVNLFKLKLFDSSYVYYLLFLKIYKTWNIVKFNIFDFLSIKERHEVVSIEENDVFHTSIFEVVLLWFRSKSEIDFRTHCDLMTQLT